MDHHHQHHLHGHGSRYVPVPPQQLPNPPVFFAPEPYRRLPHISFPPQPLPVALPPPPTAAPHHHRRLDNGGVVYVSYAPSSSHASDDRGRLLAPADLPERVVVKAPYPPAPALRVSDRIIFPEGHPDAPRVHHQPPRRSSGGEAFVREDFKRERVRVLDEGKGGLPYGRREGEAAVLVEQEDAARRVGLLGRKRTRWEEGRASGEDPLLVSFVQERDPKRLTSGASASRRRCDAVYDIRAVDPEPSRGPTMAYPSERGEPVLTFPRLHGEMPLRASSVYSVSQLELGRRPMMESETLALAGDHGYREKNFTGRGKQYVFGGEEEVHAPPKKSLQQKPSVLSRIQFAKPGYKRKCEQQVLASTASLLPVSQASTFSEGNLFKSDVPVQLDVSFKSDVLVAKEMLRSPFPSSPMSMGEVCGVRTTKKNVAKFTKDSPRISFSGPDSKISAMHTHKLKIREERFAHPNPMAKPNKERTFKSKVANKVSASSYSVAQNFDEEVTVLRSPWNKVAAEVSISPNPVQNSTDRVSPIMAEKKMADKIVPSPDAGLQSHDGNIVSSRSPKREQAKKILVPQGNGMLIPSDRIPMLKTVKKPNYDGIITTGRCPEEKLAVSSHCNEKVTSMNDPKKEVLDNISSPSVPGVPNAMENTIIRRPEEKPGKDTFVPPCSAVNSDKKISTTRTLKKKIIKKNKKKIACIAPCLPSMDSPGEISKGHVLTNSPVKRIEPSKRIQLGSIVTCSHMEKKSLEAEKGDMKDSEIVQKLSMSGSSCEDSKHLEDVHANMLSGYPEGMVPTSVRSLKNEAIKRKNTGELTLIPCAFDACPMQEICEGSLSNSPYGNPMHSKEDLRGSLSNCLEKDPNCSEEAHKDTLHCEEVHQDRLDAGEIHCGSGPGSCEDVGHLKNVHDGSTKTFACMDADIQGKRQDEHILTSYHNDVTHSLFSGKTETSVAGKLGVDNSTLELHLQVEHLETNVVGALSNAMVSMEIDINESPKKKNSTENTVKNLRGSVQQKKPGRDGDVIFREGCGHDRHLSAVEEIFVRDTDSGKKLHSEGMAFFDGESSLKADFKGGNGDGGQKLPTRPQSHSVLEELEMVCCQEDAAAVLHGPMQGRSVPLQLEAQTAIPELGKERKRNDSRTQEVILMGGKLGEVDTENSIVKGERSRELHVDALALPIGNLDAVLDPNLLMETDGRQGVLHLPCIDAFPQSSPSVIGVECPDVNNIAEQVANREHSSPLIVSEKNSPEDLITVSEEMHFAEVKQTVCDLLVNKSCDGGSIIEKPYEKFNSKGNYLSDSKTSSVSELKVSVKSDLLSLSHSLILGKRTPQQTQEAEKQSSRSHQLLGKEKPSGMKVCQRPGVSRIYSNPKNPSTRTFKKPPSHGIRHNKWYRTENPSVSSSSGQMKWPNRGSLARQSPKKLGKIQSSYIRKGNSLIRKLAPDVPSSHPYPEQTASDQVHLPETDKNVSNEDKIVSTDRLSFSSSRTVNSSFERPKTPPLPLNTKSPHPSNCSQTLAEDPLSEPGGEENIIPSVGAQCFDVNEENHGIGMAEESKVSGKKKLIYVKHRSNQLIAAPGTDPNNTSVHITEESSALPFAPPDIYYRNKNKLIRDTSLSDGQFKQEMSLPNECCDAKCHGPSKMLSLKDTAKVPRKTRLEKAMEKTYKQSRFSLVWTLNGAEARNNKCSNVLKHQKVLPYLFPWKRTTYWRSFITKAGPNLIKHSPSLISRKLQLSRQRDAIYTISNSGFSLRKSGVLSVGGSNLKWIKPMERRSRKGSEGATLATVEHEGKKKKQKGRTCSGLTMMNENCSQHKSALGVELHQGERIFRVGTVHYKMDSSRRTLVRIPDEQTPAIANNRSVHDAKISIVPRRLSIGNDEYIRVGNGNQLVRDPKRLVRILANEKIRWSLHTARLRSVRKQHYCQFFTRFGKCNKEDGKCPYIHDPTKIAICTKFLKGLCSSPNCKLTHKVIPERMPDCSYFLQGLCTNMSCPYRHVNVNPKASVCEGFLKGYCRDGDECRKKHSYLCPYFEASGECRQGSACKLHHPKRANKQIIKSRKRKLSPIHDHGRGRYFGCSVAEVGESQVLALNVDIQKGEDDIFFHEGRFAEYIGLDIDTDDEAVELNDLMDSHPISDSDLSDSQSSDASVLIRPVRIMNMDIR